MEILFSKTVVFIYYFEKKHMVLKMQMGLKIVKLFLAHTAVLLITVI